ncbi:Glutathione S-transferase 4 [Zea mays]|uniref:Glutathione S-transferase 4 n=5 Tax=Zea mays TaxID=4577 RepID=GSTF4_MAIZE|nr:glutathione S-transferase 4 [Zea mays]P46420.2 RecName: Full=Glutathione S-transferase 4; AltName: Full=GST class-phi member 4; AltName: Full=GST-27; AltName: Full=GST-IV [Zea mays]AAA20585.1 glutathione S-transferase IV [Zea mays]ACN28364.1 unknown [Zea mays]AQK42160.1 glutathione S-transferase2 [Zea mays]PWZ45839.1 Glutathione S-transferase 4 [Zea mays]CAA56047.1 glutathione transferase [Zea mays]|eukprot:NP_001105366.1 glutathione S-transferase 4 [Zea mays]
MATPAVKVYGWAISPFVSRALLALEEAGVDYELVPMSRQDGDHRRPEHLARNPFGKVPVLEDGDLTLFESRAIARHVLRKHKPELLGGGRLEQTAMVDVWLEVEAHQLSPPAIAIVVECVFAPFLGRERNQAVVDENVEKLKKVLEVYEARLATCTYLAGDFLSLADLSPFTIMHCLMATEYAALVHALPHVSAWWQGLAARPAANKVAQFMPVGAGAPKEQE